MESLRPGIVLPSRVRPMRAPQSPERGTPRANRSELAARQGGDPRRALVQVAGAVLFFAEPERGAPYPQDVNRRSFQANHAYGASPLIRERSDMGCRGLFLFGVVPAAVSVPNAEEG